MVNMIPVWDVVPAAWCWRQYCSLVLRSRFPEAFLHASVLARGSHLNHTHHSNAFCLYAKDKITVRV